jgi:3-keto-disaccharide hydrolase
MSLAGTTIAAGPRRVYVRETARFWEDEAMLRRPLWTIAIGAALFVAATTVPASASADPNPYGDPNLVAMFDGSTLTGWTASKPGAWVAQDGAIHGTGTQGRGWLYFNNQAGTFRWIFNVRQITGNHKPTVLIWGTTNPIRDALSAIQFQPPNGGHWDYRPGHNNGGGSCSRPSHTPRSTSTSGASAS